jgi:O-succinylbenzoic acid--CoA ligase
MSRPLLLLAEGDRIAAAAQLERCWREGRSAALAAAQERAALVAALPEQLEESWGPAVVLGSGGSSGGRRWCVQPLSHLHTAAAATARWLEGLGLEPARLQLFNPLPLQHVSGLMPLLRSRSWGAELRWLEPALMREPEWLLREAPPTAPALLSLVPTQLQRLVASPAGCRWLERFALIWVGGAALPAELAERCRSLGLRLSPCYGSTETAAMVAALSPERFLAGISGYGVPLPHAQLRLAPASGALEINAASLAPGFVAAGRFLPLPQRQGWWRSGDRARFGPEGLQILGRLDGAIHSGGETVLPEQVEQRLLELCRQRSLLLAELLLLPEPDPLWGECLVALFRPAAGCTLSAEILQQLARELPPSQRPRRWLLCPELERSPLGKWERQRWRRWLRPDS